MAGGTAQPWITIAALALGVLASATALAAEPLPERAPLPLENPHARSLPKPGDSRESLDSGVDDDELPVPEPRPHIEEPESPATPGPAAPPELAEKPSPPRPPDPSPGEEAACRQSLRKLGAVFSEHEPLSDPAGCSAPHPITLTRLTRDVAIEPEAILNCATAEAMATFTAGTIAPAARTGLGSPLKSIRHESAYVCRPRNGTHKLSEHAFANALDIGGFTLADGRTIDVRLTSALKDIKEANFLSQVRAAACGPFKTVLGPGTNADHRFHFHFDLQPRRNGGTYCH